ncbi:hypothetical protein ABZW03_29110, partial [Kitasatospora sp. NPDC004799]
MSPSAVNRSAVAGERDGRVRTEVAVDLGGTWLRIRTGAGETLRLPAPSVLNRPGEDPAALLDLLVETLAEAVPPDARVAMSCGAAVDTGDDRALAYAVHRQGCVALVGDDPDRAAEL